MADAPRLFLITPRLTEGASFEPLLRAALEAADIACLLIRAVAHDEPGLKSILRTLAPLAQAKNAAVLIEDPRLAARLDVDGAHLEDTGATLNDALRALQPRKIVGVGGLTSRDAAMAAGERGVDYLMFGAPESHETHEAVRDRVAWWAEIFNVPCVGYTARPDLARDMALAGAEFVGLCEGLWERPDTLVATLRDVSEAIMPIGVQ